MEWDWVEAAKEAVVGDEGYATRAFEYINDNQWAADALAGAAVAGGQYLMQKDQQDFQREQSDQAWRRKLSLTEAPELNKDDYNWSNLTDGGLTGSGGLISRANK